MSNFSSGHFTHHHGQRKLDMFKKSAKVYLGRLEMTTEDYEEMALLALVRIRLRSDLRSYW
jgi:hypothetical protein